jgi:hypothetical protein
MNTTSSTFQLKLPEHLYNPVSKAILNKPVVDEFRLMRTKLKKTTSLVAL